jgi:hypothetical protein
LERRPQYESIETATSSAERRCVIFRISTETPKRRWTTGSGSRDARGGQI